MKLEEIAPAGLIKQATTSLAQRAARGLGMGGTARRLGGVRQTQRQANTIWKQFETYLGQIGKNLNAVTVDEIREFMAGNGLVIPEDLKTLPGESIIGNKRFIADYFMQAQQGGVRQQMQQRATIRAAGSAGGRDAGGRANVSQGFQQFLQSLSAEQKQSLKAALG